MRDIQEGFLSESDEHALLTWVHWHLPNTRMRKTLSIEYHAKRTRKICIIQVLQAVGSSPTSRETYLWTDDYKRLTRSSRGEVSRHLIRLWFDEPAEKPDLTISGSSNTFLPILGFRILHHDGHIPVRSEVNSLTPQADWSSTSLGEVKTKTPAGW